MRFLKHSFDEREYQKMHHKFTKPLHLQLKHVIRT